MLKDNKKKVLHISHTDIRTDSRILKELAALSGTGLYELSAIGVDSYDLSREASINNVDIVSIRLFFTRYKWRPSLLRYILAYFELTLKLLYRGLSSSPAVVHCHDNMVLPVAWIISKAKGAKLVYDAHELESEKNSQSRINSKLTVLIEKFAWLSVDLLITVSPSIKVWYEDKYGPKLAALVLNSPVYDCAKTQEGELHESSYLREKFGIPKERKIFIYAGMLIPGRGIETILDVFGAQGTSSHIVFLGFGVLSEKVRKLASTASNIHIHDAVPHHEVIDIIHSADVGLCFIEKVSLSDYYCLPNKLFEYAFAGLPILASRFPDIESVMTRHHLGVCAVESFDGISEQVQFFEQDDFNYRPSDLDELSWNTQARRLVDAYEAMLKISRS